MPRLGKPDVVDKIEPLLRWAGGKQQLVRRLLDHLPEGVRGRVYREPFLGAGSLFFALQPCDAILSDLNEPLILCYRLVRENWALIARHLGEHRSKDSESYYYRTREVYNRSAFSFAQAARFIYLNKSCFNGIFRVNQKGEFNVPYGWKESPALPNKDVLRLASEALQKARLCSGSYEDAVASAKSGDFIYLDPPYPPLNGTSYFTHYTKDRFDEKDQKRLAAIVKELDRRGCWLMMSNADVMSIRRLYKQFRMTSLSVTRFISCKATKHIVKELVITNYDPPRLNSPEEKANNAKTN
jgi:DNA adenine methylase